MGPLILSLVLVVDGVLLRPGIPLPDIEEVPAGTVDSHMHLFVADVIESFDTVDRGILDRVLLLGFVMCILSIMLMFACALSVLLALVSLGLVMVVYSRAVL